MPGGKMDGWRLSCVQVRAVDVVRGGIDMRAECRISGEDPGSAEMYVASTAIWRYEISATSSAGGRLTSISGFGPVCVVFCNRTMEKKFNRSSAFVFSISFERAEGMLTEKRLFSVGLWTG